MAIADSRIPIPLPNAEKIQGSLLDTLTNNPPSVTIMTDCTGRNVVFVYKICKTEESAQRQREFERSLLELMKSVPYDAISVTDLCNHVGIARKNFYRYFGNKDDVLCALLDHTLLDYSKYEMPDFYDAVTAPKEIVQYLSYWQKEKPLLDALSANGLSTKLIERVLMHAWQQDTGFLRVLEVGGKEADPNTVLFAVSGIITLVVTWHHSGYKEPKEQLASAIFRLMTEPIATVPQ